MISVSDSTLVLKSRRRIFSLVIDHRLVERASSGEALVQSHRAARGIAKASLIPCAVIGSLARVTYPDKFLKGADQDLSGGISVRQNRRQPADRRPASVSLRAGPQRTFTSQEQLLDGQRAL
jgi:hypothetical protein